MTWQRKCLVCRTPLRTPSGKCSACRRRQQQIQGSHKAGYNCTVPHPLLAERLALLAERAAREEPLFDGTERR